MKVTMITCDICKQPLHANSRAEIEFEFNGICVDATSDFLELNQLADFHSKCLLKVHHEIQNVLRQYK